MQAGWPATTCNELAEIFNVRSGQPSTGSLAFGTRNFQLVGRPRFPAKVDHDRRNLHAC